MAMTSLSDDEFLGKGSVKRNLADWRRLAGVVAQSLGCDDLDQDVDRRRVLHYYLPVFYWVRQQVTDCKKRGKTGPCVVGISAPQGCGKTTLVGELEKLLTVEGFSAASLSIDDFYLRRSDLLELKEAAPTNTLLHGRGNAGTHDLALGTETLANLQAAKGPVKLPRYDKSAFSGAGDRAEPETWPEVQPPVDVVLFEGWMLGFRAVPVAAATAIHPGLFEVNTFLRRYRSAWDAYVDSWLVIEVANAQWVFKWRLQAEQQMRAAGKPGMSDEEVGEFVRRYIPAYEAYLPQLYVDGPTTARPGRTLFVRVGETRELLGGRGLPIVRGGMWGMAGAGIVAACVALTALLAAAQKKRKVR